MLAVSKSPVRSASIVIWLLVSFVVTGVTHGQVIVNKLGELAQYTPLHVYRAQKLNRVFLYTLDGLNISNGQRTKVYKKSTHNLLDNELSGRFYEDITGRVWFTTTRCLNVYLPEIDDFENVQMKDKTDQIIESGYKLLGEWDSVSVMLQAGGELMIYDVYEKRITRRFDISIDHYSIVVFGRESIVDNIIVGNTNETILYRFTDSDTQVIRFPFDPSSVKIFGNHLFISTTDGRLKIVDMEAEKTVDEIDFGGNRVFDVKKIGGKYLVTTNEGLFWMNAQDFSDREQLELLDYDGVAISSGYLIPSVDGDSILWVGITGRGVYAFNLARPLMEHWPVSSNKNERVRATKILEDELGNFYVFSFTEKLYQLDPVGRQINSWSNRELLGERVHADWWNGKLFFESKKSLRLFDPIKSTMDTIEAADIDIVQTRIHRNQGYFSISKNYLLRINPSHQLDTIAYLRSDRPNGELRYFGYDMESRLYASNADLSIAVFDSNLTTLLAELPVSGGLLSITDIGSEVLITNREGLFKVNKHNHEVNQVLDVQGKLSQQIYGLLIDDNGFYWMSTNSGILRYDPQTNLSFQFKPKDGLQSTEFNRMSYMKDSKGRVMVGGINGINVFDPLKMKLSDRQATVDFHNYKINDENSDAFGVANYVDQFDLYYDNNTITFEFIGVDYVGPKHVNLKYFMEGYDKDWVTLEENNGVARYANLPYGDYKFHMLASNADEVWAAQAKTVDVVVHSPLWATTWFRTIASVLLLWAGYALVRARYRRKIERRDLILNQQALLLEKKEAIEYERTRIASEMHDDLGSGLTTIKYLSEHAMNSFDSIEEKSKIKRIAEQAGTLVSNMSEIIWAMNGRYDTANDLVGYIRRYASEFLTGHQKTLQFNSEVTTDNLEISGEKRRNIFLVTKEILHNFVKYANVEQMQIDLYMKDDRLCIEFLEVASKGFEPDSALGNGNGLFNMKKRMEQIRGTLTQELGDDGYRTTIIYPLNE